MSPPTDGRSSETANSARSGFSIGARFLSYLSATWCGAVFLMLGALWTGFISLIQTYLHLISTTRALELAAALPAVCIGGILDFALGIAFGRFLLRTMPPHLLDRTRRRQLAIIAVAVFATLIGIYVSLCSFWMPPFVAAMTKLSPSQLDEIVHRFQRDAPAMTDLWPWQYGSIAETSALLLAGAAESVLFAILWATGAVGPLILRHPRPRAFLDRPFVLFLRRFSTFADRTVVALILRQAKAGVPVVFLTPTRSRPRDWDPFLVGFAGLKFLRPLGSVPMVLRARDDDWQRGANELVDRAQTILVDTSKESAALRTEAEMIDRAGRWSDTVCLRNTAYTPGSGQDPLDAFGTARCIDYSKSWRRALPRLAVSLALVILTALLIAVFTVSGGSILLFIALSKIGVWNGTMSGVILFLLLSLVFVAVALTSYSIFWRPAVSRSAKIELSRVLRADHPTSIPAEQSVDMISDRSTNGRPISIAVIAWITLVSNALLLLGSIMPVNKFAVNNPVVQEMIAKNPIPTPVQHLTLFTGVIISMVSAIFMLRGANWARLLYICWGAFSLVIAFFTSPAKPILGIVFYLVVVFFLLRPKASAYFIQHNVRTD
jgi:hypothetical protein